MQAVITCSSLYTKPLLNDNHIQDMNFKQIAPETFLSFKKWVYNTQAVGYNGARTLYKYPSDIYLEILSIFLPNLLQKMQMQTNPETATLQGGKILHFGRRLWRKWWM